MLRKKTHLLRVNRFQCEEKTPFFTLQEVICFSRLMAGKRLHLLSSGSLTPLQTYLCKHWGPDLHPTSTDAAKGSVYCGAARGFSGDPDQLRFGVFAHP